MRRPTRRRFLPKFLSSVIRAEVSHAGRMSPILQVILAGLRKERSEERRFGEHPTIFLPK
jgi:hypothetical protein